MFQINTLEDLVSIITIGSIMLGTLYGITKFIASVNQLAKQVKEIDDSSTSTHKRIFDITDSLKKEDKSLDKRLSIVEHDLKQAGITSVPIRYDDKKGDDT